MTPEERRSKIVALLSKNSHPVAGSRLASELAVSRQVIVQDVSILRASGKKILSTPRGYMIAQNYNSVPYRKTFAVRHNMAQMEDELNIMVDAGGTVIDVIVEHPLYGELKGMLMLKSRRDVKEFAERKRVTGSKMLSDVTGGVHLHTVEAEKEDVFSYIEAELSRAGYLLDSCD